LNKRNSFNPDDRIFYSDVPYKGLQQCPNCQRHSSFNELKHPVEKISRKTGQGLSIQETEGLGLKPTDRVCPYCMTVLVREPKYDPRNAR